MADDKNPSQTVIEGITRVTGSIKHIPHDEKTNRPKGFGFIAGDDGRDYFFHQTHLNVNTIAFRSLRPFDRVHFTSEDTDTGPKAFDIIVGII